MSESEPDADTEAEPDVDMDDLDTPVLNVEVRAMSELEPYSDNPMEHDNEQLAALTESIRKFGFKNPLTIAPDGSVVAGHGRLEAAQELSGDLESDIEEHREAGNDSVADDLQMLEDGDIYVIVADDLDEDERDEFRIADNKVFEHSNWDRDSLRFELRELGDAVGFDDDEVEGLLDISGGSIDYDPGEVAERKEELEEKYREMAEDKRSRKRGFSCPCCGDQIYLDGEQLRNALRRSVTEEADE